MKLKGKNAEKIKDVKREKMENTLKRMEEIRNRDAIMMRKKVEEELVAMKDEFQKAIKVIESLNARIVETQNMKLKIEGAIISLTKVLE